MNLVRLTTQDVSRAYPVTDSLIIADQFNKKHFNVLRDIRELEEQLKDSLSAADFNAYKIEGVNYRDKKNEQRECFNINESFFMMLVMGYNTKKALIIKNEFIKQFIFMKHELIARGETRHIGISIRKDMTKTIVEHTPEGNFKKFAISNYTKLIYKKVLGMQIKKYKELHNIQKGAKNRDFLTRDQLDKVQYYESKIADIVEVSGDIVNEKELYSKIKFFIEKPLE